jgi:tetratricopeptide (TPR) repeat protein
MKSKLIALALGLCLIPVGLPQAACSAIEKLPARTQPRAVIDDSEDEIEIANYAAMEAFARHRYTEAVSRLYECIAGLKGEDTGSYWLAVALSNLQVAATAAGDDKAAADARDQAHKIYQDLDFKLTGDATHLNAIPATALARKQGQQIIRQIHLDDNSAKTGEDKPTGDHVIYVLCMTLGEAAKKSGRLEQAENFFKRALLEAQAGKEDKEKHAASSIGALAAVYRYQKDFDKAQKTYQQAEQLIKAAYGEASTEYATILDNEAIFNEEMGKSASANELRQKALSVYEKNGPSVDLAITYGNIGGSALGTPRDLEKAELFLSRALDMFKKFLPADEPRIATIEDELGIVYFHRGDLDKAEQNQRAALASFEKYYGPYSLDTAATLSNLAATCYEKHDYKQFKSLMDRYVKVLQQVYGTDSPETKKAVQRYAHMMGSIKPE